MQHIYPFAAIVGQEELKKALLMAAVDPSLGGVLAFGDRGTGKTTAIRALAALLPEIETNENCQYNCVPGDALDMCRVCNPPDETGQVYTRKSAPVIDLPLGATEDRVCGALDLERALLAGEKAFEPGLLAKAHRGFLYIDEVNLLEDHIVDLLLDVAASGMNVVEREGLSVRHPARFVLVGSGNPEEGELRPQLLDRFGVSIQVSSPKSIAERVEVVKRRDAFERDPAAFMKVWSSVNGRIRARVTAAQGKLDETEIPDPVFENMASLCLTLGIDGLRGELTLMRAARINAVLDGRLTVGDEDVIAVAPMALAHRLRRDPLDDAGSSVRVEKALQTVFSEPQQTAESNANSSTSASARHETIGQTYGHA
ncbi:MAG: magnesium chelatase ATPase subunit I [Pseudomonadota bacterium]